MGRTSYRTLIDETIEDQGLAFVRTDIRHAVHDSVNSKESKIMFDVKLDAKTTTFNNVD